LSDDALSILDEWLSWLLSASMPVDGVLADIRASLIGA